MDLIDEYFEYATEACDAPSIYHKAISYWIGSSLLGRFARIVTSYAPEGIAPNLWVLLIGPSRVVRKSTASDLGEGFVSKVEDKLVMPASFTPEGLYDLLNGVQPGTARAWIKDEMSGFFKSLQKKYMYGMREILSMIYRGKGETRKLRSLTFTIPKGIYITVLSNMASPPHLFMTEEDFYSGFLNRFLLIYARMREKRIPILHTDMMLDMKVNNLISKYKKLISHYMQISPIPVSANSEALKMLDDYELQVEDEILRLERDNPSSLWKMYVSESPYHLLKMSTIRRLCRDPIVDRILVIEKVDVEKAFEDLKRFLECAREVVEDVQTSATPAPVLTEEKELNRVYDIIRSKGDEGALKSEILLKLQISRDRLNKIILTLFEQDKIIVVRAYSQSKGRKALKFYTSEHRLKAMRDGEIINDVQKLEVLLK